MTCQYEPSGLDEFATLCPAAMEWRAKWSAVVAEKVALEATLAEVREQAAHMIEEADRG
jgi:hypothetical protein